jgi:hypothetical protein
MANLAQKLPLDQMQTKWAAQINPVLASPTNNSSILEGVKLVSGVNVINHLLGRPMQGWIITDINAAITVYRSAPMNNLTLTLTASGAATVNIEVF